MEYDDSGTAPHLKIQRELFNKSVRCVGGSEDRRRVAHMPQHVEARGHQVSALLL